MTSDPGSKRFHDEGTLKLNELLSHVFDSINQACILAMVKCCGEDGREGISSCERHPPCKSISQKAAEEMIAVGEYFQDFFLSEVLTVSAMCFDNM